MRSFRCHFSTGLSGRAAIGRRNKVCRIGEAELADTPTLPVLTALIGGGCGGHRSNLDPLLEAFHLLEPRLLLSVAGGFAMRLPHVSLLEPCVYGGVAEGSSDRSR